MLDRANFASPRALSAAIRSPPSKNWCFTVFSRSQNSESGHRSKSTVTNWCQCTVNNRNCSRDSPWDRSVASAWLPRARSMSTTTTASPRESRYAVLGWSFPYAMWPFVLRIHAMSGPHARATTCKRWRDRAMRLAVLHWILAMTMACSFGGEERKSSLVNSDRRSSLNCAVNIQQPKLSSAWLN